MGQAGDVSSWRNPPGVPFAVPSSSRSPSRVQLFCMINPVAMCYSAENVVFRIMIVGYARVSTSDDRQSVDLQRDALAVAGVDDRHLHQDRASGARDDRPGLKACLADLRSGDVLVVWKLDRLAALSAEPPFGRRSGCLEARPARRSLCRTSSTSSPNSRRAASAFDPCGARRLDA